MQQQLEDIEIQIWEYLDGTCTKADRLRIGQLISANETWCMKYAELRALQTQLLEIETDHPSMRFTANVMETIASTYVIGTTARYINNRVVRGIAAFYLLLIGSVIIFSIIAMNASGSNSTSSFNFQKYLNSDVLKAIMFINIILALILVDKFIRRQEPGKISV